MKIRKNIYLVLGILLILVNILSTLGRLNEIKSKFADPARGIGYLIGTHLLLFIGIFFLYAAIRVQKKIKRKELQALENNFLSAEER